VKRSSIVIHRNIRFVLPLMVNVEVPVSYQLSTTSGSGPGIRNARMNDFTPRAQQVLTLARKEAERFNHNYVGTEHLLLGLIKLGQGVAVNVLQKMGVDLEIVRMEVEKHVGSHPETQGSPFHDLPVRIPQGDMAGSIAVRSRKEECGVDPVVFDEVSRGACL
jgi:hypothetical protein